MISTQGGGMTIKLVSFAVCPFVQRSVILLRQKKIEYSIEYIDLNEPPEWFPRLSPTGKVPLLLVDDAVLFESSVILDFLDECFAPRYHPEDSLQRAQHKSWIEYGSTLLMGQHAMVTATEHEEFLDKQAVFEQDIVRLEEPLNSGLFGDKRVFTLVDAALAPLFMRLRYQSGFYPAGHVEIPDAVASWAERLLALPAVQHSVVDDFPDRYRDFLKSKNSWLLHQY
jgi:glutathione S-transferase